MKVKKDTCQDMGVEVGAMERTSDLIGEMENRASLENGEGGKYRRVK